MKEINILRDNEWPPKSSSNFRYQIIRVLQNSAVFQQRLGTYYSSEFLQNIEGYNNLRNKIQEETSNSVDPYQWLEPNDPR